MRKTAFFLALVLLLTSVVMLPASAAEPRMISIVPTLQIDNNTAYCDVTVTGNNSTESLYIVVRLWRGGTCLRTWGTSGTGYIILNRSADVTPGYTYTLTVDLTANGVKYSRVSSEVTY